MFDKDPKETLDTTKEEQVFHEIHQLNPALGVMLVTAFESASSADQLHAVKNYVNLMYNVDLGPSIIEVQAVAGNLTNDINFKAIRQAAIVALDQFAHPKKSAKTTKSPTTN